MKLSALEKDIAEYLREHKIKLLDGRRMECPPSGTILRWASEHLIPSPTGGTRYATWPGWSLEQTVTTAYLLGKEGWSRGRLWSARVSIGLRLERGGPLIDELDRLWLEDSPDYADAVLWVISVLKVHCDWALGDPATIVESMDEITRNLEYMPMPPIEEEGIHPIGVDRLIRADKLGG